jgi:hypothetical protein
MSGYEERIEYYIKLVAVNCIKAHMKAKTVKVFPEYDTEVEMYIALGKQRWIEENVGIWV